MTFQQFFTVLWRNRVMITIAATAFCVVVFGLLFAYHPEFQVAVINLAITIATFIFYCLMVLLAFSIMWKGIKGNFKGGGGGKK